MQRPHASDDVRTRALATNGAGRSVADVVAFSQNDPSTIRQRRRFGSGQTVILNNMAVHKSAVAQHAIEAAGVTLQFLPANSPDFNPIEQAFATLKQHLRTRNARTVETVLAAT